MACGYCHNPELVKGLFRKLPEEKIIDFLESRIGLLEGVVLSGGECTLCPALPELAAYLKSLGFKVKIDTNGTKPDVIEKLLNKDLVDFIAMDFKAPEEKFAKITGYSDYKSFSRSLELICKSGIDAEIRTTVHADMLDERDINKIIRVLEDNEYTGSYFVQKFRSGKTLDNLEVPTRNFDVTKLAEATFEVNLRGFSKIHEFMRTVC